MAKRDKSTPFANLVAEVRSQPPRERVVRPGGVNRDGDFFDPDGRMLRLTAEEISPAAARTSVAGGAQVVFEACGCGGGGGDCVPDWIDTTGLTELPEPRFTDANRTPTWIDLWSSDQGEVVYLHGSVAWGDRLG